MRVDFYILADVDEIARQRFTCRLAGRAVAQYLLDDAAAETVPRRR